MLLLQDLFSRNGTKYKLELQQLEILAVVSPTLTFMCRFWVFKMGIKQYALGLLLNLSFHVYWPFI